MNVLPRRLAGVLQVDANERMTVLAGLLLLPLLGVETLTALSVRRLLPVHILVVGRGPAWPAGDGGDSGGASGQRRGVRYMVSGAAGATRRPSMIRYIVALDPDGDFPEATCTHPRGLTESRLRHKCRL